jgi:hypothetical protein
VSTYTHLWMTVRFPRGPSRRYLPVCSSHAGGRRVGDEPMHALLLLLLVVLTLPLLPFLLLLPSLQPRLLLLRSPPEGSEQHPRSSADVVRGVETCFLPLCPKEHHTSHGGRHQPRRSDRLTQFCAINQKAVLGRVTACEENDTKVEAACKSKGG